MGRFATYRGRMVKGSDCVTGKAQYANATTARASARVGRRQGSMSLRAYRCKWCGCWHIGNRRGDNSKSRRR